MTDQAKRIMDEVMDRRKIVKVREFRKSGSQWRDVSPTYGPGNNWDDNDFEQWQRNNKDIRVIGTSVIRRVTENPSPPPPAPPPPTTFVEEIMYVSYEITEPII